ncbi:FAD-binding oxidoreductase [Inhella sp.]|uniref:FAD-binding oxidoreductase n=1 Tax=Inhella sp. TaxID=1921806 RepID=UPI0035AF6A77
MQQTHDTNSLTDQAFEAWRDLLGDGQVDGPQEASRRYGMDTTGSQRRLAGALRVVTEAQIQQVLRIANQHGRRLHPISTGRNWGYGTALPSGQDCTLIDLGGMRKILHFDRRFGVVTLEPGVTQEDLARFLDSEGLPYLVPVTGAGPKCSVLANALERGYGVTPYTDHFGAVTDLRAVMPDGRLYQGMLSEAAGPELGRLFRWGVGAYTQGLFSQSGIGIVTQISIALAPRPECLMACLFSVPREDLLGAAVEAIQQANQRLGGTLGAINLMNRHRMLSMSAPYPWDHLGPDGLIPSAVLEEMGRRYHIAPWTGFATLYGSRRMVRAAQDELRSLLKGFATRVLFITPQRAQSLARLARLIPGRAGNGLQRLTGTLAKSLELVAGRPNHTALPLAYWRKRGEPPAGSDLDPGQDGCGLMWYAPLVPMHSDATRDYADFVHQTMRPLGIEPLITFTSLGDRLFDSTVPILFDRADESACRRAEVCLLQLVSKGRERGFFPYRLPISAMGLLREFAPTASEFNRRLHQLHDPSDLLAPERYR